MIFLTQIGRLHVATDRKRLRIRVATAFTGGGGGGGGGAYAQAAQATQSTRDAAGDAADHLRGAGRSGVRILDDDRDIFRNLHGRHQPAGVELARRNLDLH